MQIPPEEERFAKNATIMANAIYNGVQKLYDNGYKVVEPHIILFALELIKELDKHSLIQGFIKNSHQDCWDKMKDRNEEFFVENASTIFAYLPMNNVNLFKDLFLTVDNNGNSVISQTLKDEIWTLLDAMVKISIKYVYKNGNIETFKDVNLNHHSKVWNVVLQ